MTTDTNHDANGSGDSTGAIDVDRRTVLGGTAALGVGGTVGLLTGSDRATARHDGSNEQHFRVRIENVAATDTYAADASTGGAVWLTPGAYGVHQGSNPILTEGSSATPGLEAIAEAGIPTGFPGEPGLVSELSDDSSVSEAAAFTPEDTTTDPNDPMGEVPGAPPIAPGGAFEFVVGADPGDSLSFATMFVPSNDLFYAPESGGISLFDADGTPASGDMTGEIELWDAGTEPNGQPGFGPDQAPAQDSPDQGSDEGGVVRRIGDVDDGHSYPSVSDSIRVTITPVDPQPFTVRIENVAATDTYAADASTGGAVWLTPGVYSTHTGPNPILSEGEAASPGLEAIAEAGIPTGFPDTPGLTSELASASNVTQSGAFTPADTATDPNDPMGEVPGAPPIAPGGAFEFTVEAFPGEKLSFASMFVPSNDLFYAPESGGIPLFDAGGTPISGDVTGEIELWDAGTEPNGQPGFDPDQAPAQDSPDQGADEGGVVRRIGDVDDGHSYPAVADAIQVSVEPAEPQAFRVRVENTAATDTYAADASTGGAVWLTPGAYGVHQGSNPILTEGEAASPGLEAIAEAGIPTGFPGESGLLTELSRDPDVTRAGMFTPANTVADPNDPMGEVPGAPPIAPGGAFEFTVRATPGERLSLATMFVPSNDLFYAPGSDGIRLFDSSGTPVSGDVTGEMELWDAGTEPNSQPGFGPDQAPAQDSPDQGADEDGVVRRIGDVDDGHSYPSVSDSISVSVEPVEPEPLTIRIENVASTDTYASDGPTGGAVWLTPGAYGVHTGANPAFTEGEEASPGLEAIAEAGIPTGFPGEPGLVSELGAAANVTTAGAFTPEDTVADPNDPMGEVPGAPPIAPGGAFEFTIDAVPGDALTFATMFVPSNDLFYAPGSDGIPLFDSSGDPISGDVTDQVDLWDAGTEPNQQPGSGPDQAPAQDSPDQGADEGGVVRRIGDVDDGYSYPDAVRVSVTPGSASDPSPTATPTDTPTDDGGDTISPGQPGLGLGAGALGLLVAKYLHSRGDE
jgi:hypothetical protein